MKIRTSAMFVTFSAVVAGVLVAMPAEAASYEAFVKSSRVAISTGGNGKVAVACHSNHTCKGKISFTDDTGEPRERAYEVSPNKSSYVYVAMHTGTDNAINPHNAPDVPGRDYKSVDSVSLKVNEDSPKNITHYYNIAAETLVSRQDITGQVHGQGVLASNIRVDLIRTLKGGNTQIVKGDDVAQDGTFTLGVNLGANNSSSSPYRLRISGTDQDGNRRSWYWRGSDDNFTGGGAYLRDATVIRATRTNDFDADFTYSSISGTTTRSGAEVTVAGPPPSFSGGSSTRRELDFPSCANIFGQTTSDGSYDITFIPATSAKAYMVGGKSGSTNAWYGSDATERYGSCYDVEKYDYSRDNLMTLSTPVIGKSVDVEPSNNNLTVNASFSPAYHETYNDRWIRLREKVPGLPILDSPVIREKVGDSNGNREFTDVAPGDYWVEVGRRTGCSDWYPSKFPNNRLYFKGTDRYSENWKSFTKVSHLQGDSDSGMESRARHADPNPATIEDQNHIPKGYAGWMYRAYCKAYGAGTINSTTITGTGHTDLVKVTSRNPKGAIVRGHVSRVGGKTNKEMMVRLSSSAGTRVLRTDVTDSSGNFYIAGLPSGSWSVSVNSDSWRGIGRTFTGRHSISVKAGHSYNLGTLRFKS